MDSPSDNRPPAYYLKAGIDAQNAGDLELARNHYLAAAQLLLELARQASVPHVRQQRFDQANRVMSRVEEIDRRLEEKKEQQNQSRGQVAAPVHAEEVVPEWLLAQRPDVRLQDVAGLDDVKEQIHVKLIYPFTHPEKADRFGIRPGGGILLYGPPGTGKTYIASAVVGELDAAFFVAKASSLMSQWFGKAEQNIAALFDAARQQDRSVIFLDEVEALVPKRGATRSSVMPRVIAEFLAQTQSLGDDGSAAILLMGATNEPWAIDAAAMRPGRFDELVYVGLPPFEARVRLLELNLHDRPLSRDIHLPALAELLEGFSGADIAYICTKAGELAFLDAVQNNLDRAIDMEDFQAVLATRTPSVSPDQLRRYEKFRRERS